MLLFLFFLPPRIRVQVLGYPVLYILVPGTRYAVRLKPRKNYTYEHELSGISSGKSLVYTSMPPRDAANYLRGAFDWWLQHQMKTTQTNELPND